MTAIFYHDDDQKRIAELTKEQMQRVVTRPIMTSILPATTFYLAECYHQKYMLQNHPKLFQSLDITTSEVIDSHVATRLNGYLGGYGDKSEFESEWKKLKISEEQADYIRSHLVKTLKPS